MPTSCRHPAVARRRRRAGLGAAFTAALVSALAPAGAGASPAPGSLVRSSLAAALRQRSVHYVAVSNFGGPTVSEVGDAAVGAGSQVITVRRGRESGQLTVRVSGGDAFIRGDAFALETYLGFAAAASVAHADTWILVPPGDRDYGPIAAGVTLGSLVETLEVAPPLTRLGGARVAGRRVLRVRGSAPSAAGISAAVTIVFEPSPALLPVEEVAVQGAASARVTLSRWNEPVSVVRPSRAMPISATGLE